MPNISIQKITNLYLYGSETKPRNLVDDTLIRTEVRTIDPPAANVGVDVVQFMATGAGRFAIGALFDLVQIFFSQTTILKPNVSGYTKDDLKKKFGIDYLGFSFSQVTRADGNDDWLARAYIYNSMEFKISDNARFYVDANGNRRIENFAVEPRFESESFDFHSNNFFANAANTILGLEDKIDPSRIGRRVDINWVGSVPTSTYDLNDFQADVRTYQSWTVPIVNPMSAVQTLTNGLWSSGTTQFLNGQSPIVYGTLSDDTLSA